VKAEGDLDRFQKLIESEIDGVTRTRQVEGAVEGHVQGAGGQLLPEIIRMADSQGFQVLDLSVREPTLETVFINLTGKDLRD
jgi:ABC-2 type transport system ATP-binding protein